MRLSETLSEKSVKQTLSKRIRENYKNQSLEEKEYSLSESLVFDIPFFTSKIQSGKPLLEFPETNHKSSLHELFSFYERLYEIVQSESEKRELNTEILMGIIKENFACNSFIEKIGPNIFKDTLIFPFVISEDLKIGSWLYFDFALSENKYLDLTGGLIEIENFENIYISNSGRGNYYSFDPFNYDMIEDLKYAIKKNGFENYLYEEMPIFIKNPFTLNSSQKDASFVKDLKDYIYFYQD